MTQMQKTLVLSSFDHGPSVQTAPIPQPTSGSAVVQVLCANVLAYASDLFGGKMGYPLVFPSVIGGSCIGRIHMLGPDATTLKQGQLILVDSFYRARDNPSINFLSGTHAGISSGARLLAEGEWRDSTYAEFAKVPLENIHILNEAVLCQKLSYTEEELGYLLRLMVPMGGLGADTLDIKAGDTIIIAPATGAFGGGAVEVAVALGATVVAAARNLEALRKLEHLGDGGSVHCVQLSGNPEKDAQALSAFGPVDAYLDFSPRAAAKSTHILASLMALKDGGKACLMGGISDTISLPYLTIMFKNIKLMGRFMYEREAVDQLIKLAERGKLTLGKSAGLRVAGTFGLGEWKEAFDSASKNSGWGVQTLINPRK